VLAAQYFLVPLRPDYLSEAGWSHLQGNISSVIEEYNYYAQHLQLTTVAPSETGIVFSMVAEMKEEPIAEQREYIERIKALQAKVFTHYFKLNNTLFAGAPERGIPVILSEFTPSEKTKENVIAALNGFGQEFCTTLGI
jgi:chromosome partitioning protein